LSGGTLVDGVRCLVGGIKFVAARTALASFAYCRYDEKLLVYRKMKWG